MLKRPAWLSRRSLLRGCLLFGGLACSIVAAPAQSGGGRTAGAGSAPAKAASDVSAPRQVTVFAIVAIPGSNELDPRLSTVQAQLEKVLPKHGFKLRDVRSKRIETGQSVACDLGNGYKAQTVLVKSLDENGKVQLRCNLMHERNKEFSTLVRSPLNQLFFCEHSLKEGTRVLIGVGAR